MLARSSLRALSAVLSSPTRNKTLSHTSSSFIPSSFYSYNQKFNRIEYLLLGALTLLSILCCLEQLSDTTGSSEQLTAREYDTFDLTIPFSSSVDRRHREAAVTATHSSPAQIYSGAYTTLCVGDPFVFGTLVLFHSLKTVNAKADLVALVYDLGSESIRLLNMYGVRTFVVSRLDVDLYRGDSIRQESMEVRDGVLWSKLRVWQLEDYDKIVMLDTDLLVLKNCDELFNYPEFAASPSVDRREKISFWRSPEMGMVVRNKNTKDHPPPMLHWSGLNSGVTVLVPSNRTFTALVTEISLLPNRPCCPSQEFLYFFFESRKKYVRLAPVYNARMLQTESELVGVADDRSLVLENIKIYHFVGAKPWKKRDTSLLNRVWWEHATKVVQWFGDRGVEESVFVREQV